MTGVGRDQERGARIGPEDLFDLAHYAAAAGCTFADGAEAHSHFRARGEAEGLTPSPFFYPGWYRWQNPDCARFPSSLAHFAATAIHGPIDPAPFIDSAAFLRGNPHYRSIVAAMQALVEGRDRSISPHLEDHLDALSVAQERVHKAIRSRLIGAPSGTRRRLVWVQSGRVFRPAAWFRPDAGRSWDLLCNWYSLRNVDLRFGEMHLRQSGTKATGIHHALTHHPAIFERYDQFLFLDDDLGFAHEDIERVFDVAELNGLDLFQPSLAPGSYCVWPDLFQLPGCQFHETTGVEIMMPGFSRRALGLCAPAFGRSVSGFGLDFCYSETVRGAGMTCGVVDAVAAEHFEAIDERGGRYYQFMRSLGINHKLELFQTIRDIGRFPEFARVGKRAVADDRV